MDGGGNRRVPTFVSNPARAFRVLRRCAQHLSRGTERPGWVLDPAGRTERAVAVRLGAARSGGAGRVRAPRQRDVASGGASGTRVRPRATARTPARDALR